MEAVHTIMVIGEYGCKRDLWNKQDKFSEIQLYFFEMGISYVHLTDNTFYQNEEQEKC